MPGHDRSEGVPIRRKIFCNWSSFVVPGKRGRPVYISAMMQPADQMSIEVLYVLDPSKTSGALYHRVTTSLEKVLTGMPNALARPKSASLSWPLLLIKRF